METSPYTSKERDVVDPIKSTSITRVTLLGKASPVNIPAKVTKNNGGEQKKRRKRKKKWTKPAGKPKRPLSAYNIFFAQERLLMLGKDVPTAEQEALKKKVHCKTHGKISFAVMARTIGAKWKALGSDEKKVFEDRARKLKARYLIELASWKETQKNDVLMAGSDVGKVVEDATPGLIKSGPEVIQARPDSTVAVAATVPDSNVESSAYDNNSNLMRLIFEEENRRRYLSLLRQQANPLADYSQANRHRYSQTDQAIFHLERISRRVPTPVDSFSGPRPLQHLNVDALSADRTLLRDLQGFQNPSFQDYNSRYLQVLEEYATILQLEQQHKRMAGGFNGRNNGL